MEGKLEEILKGVEYAGKGCRIPINPITGEGIEGLTDQLKWIDLLDDENMAAAVGRLTETEAVNCALTTAARIEEDITYKARVWGEFSDEERFIMASACPAALQAELELQYREAIHQGPTAYEETGILTEKACKATTSKKKQSTSQKVDEGLEKRRSSNRNDH